MLHTLVKMLKFRLIRISIINYSFGAVCLFLIFLNILILKNCSKDDTSKHYSLNLKHGVTDSDKTYVVFGKDVESGYLRHVFDILHFYGYKRIPISETNNWDLMWAHEYPFKNFSYLKNLLPHQKINHFPGSGFITNKMDLSTSDLPFTPKAFKLPIQKENFLKYVSDHPKTKYVVKSNDHRGIKIVGVDGINFNEQGIFIQEYIDNPLLVDGYKFDIGVYTIISSLDPLRVYVYDGDALFRYCTVKYYPFNPSNTAKYVIGDDYLPTWEVPSLKKYYSQLGFSMKNSFNAYISDQGLEYKQVWKNIEEAIRIVCTQKESFMVRLLKTYKTRHNFFELMRFDFVVDNNFNVFLMEVNMSPNLSSLHFKQNRLLYEQVLYNLFSLVGLGISHRIGLNNSALVDDKNIAISSPKCKSCSNCDDPECQICLNCLSSDFKNDLKFSYVENMNKKDCKRIFPSDWGKKAVEYGYKLNTKNKLLMRWYQEKCNEDEKWCS